MLMCASITGAMLDQVQEIAVVALQEGQRSEAMYVEQLLRAVKPHIRKLLEYDREKRQLQIDRGLAPGPRAEVLLTNGISGNSMT